MARTTELSAGASALATPPPPGRGIYCNRTLNLRSVRAIGYDMDYTLVHYHVEAWERRAYEHLQAKLVAQGWPVADLGFDPDLVIRGLIIDQELGNLVKADRFGYVKEAMHGTAQLDFNAQRRTYSRVIVDPAEGRFEFVNTLFSLSEGTMYAQLVERLDAGLLPGVLGYEDLYRRVRAALDAAHMEGRLKAEIMEEPERFVVLDPEAPTALLDQRQAGKKLLLITNSDWAYTRFMMAYAYDRFLPEGMSWRDLFDLVIVAARKPDFFSVDLPMFTVVDADGHLAPWAPASAAGAVLYGGNAALVEGLLGLDEADILYVGDHMFSDVHVSKSVRRWRTALILRELEDELVAVLGFADDARRLAELMAEKIALEYQHAHARLAVQRRAAGDGRVSEQGPDGAGPLQARLAALRAELLRLDARIAPLARAAGELNNARWGLLMRAGNDKSYLARQIERHADVYTSRVSNFLFETPFAYLRSAGGSLPHDPAPAAARTDPAPDAATGPG